MLVELYQKAEQFPLGENDPNFYKKLKIGFYSLDVRRLVAVIFWSLFTQHIKCLVDFAFRQRLDGNIGQRIRDR